jgi:hypothetical protein
MDAVTEIENAIRAEFLRALAALPPALAAG